MLLCFLSNHIIHRMMNVADARARHGKTFEHGHGVHAYAALRRRDQGTSSIRSSSALPPPVFRQQLPDHAADSLPPDGQHAKALPKPSTMAALAGSGGSKTVSFHSIPLAHCLPPNMFSCCVAHGDFTCGCLPKTVLCWLAIFCACATCLVMHKLFLTLQLIPHPTPQACLTPNTSLLPPLGQAFACFCACLWICLSPTYILLYSFSLLVGLLCLFWGLTR